METGSVKKTRTGSEPGARIHSSVSAGKFKVPPSLPRSPWRGRRTCKTLCKVPGPCCHGQNEGQQPPPASPFPAIHSVPPTSPEVSCDTEFRLSLSVHLMTEMWGWGSGWAEFRKEKSRSIFAQGSGSFLLSPHGSLPSGQRRTSSCLFPFPKEEQLSPGGLGGPYKARLSSQNLTLPTSRVAFHWLKELPRLGVGTSCPFKSVLQTATLSPSKEPAL